MDAGIIAIAKFADDNVIVGKVSCNNEIINLQMDIDRLSEWAIIWQMELNVDKCEVIHFGRKNAKANY